VLVTVRQPRDPQDNNIGSIRTPDDREDQRPRSLCPVMSFGGYLGIGEEDLHRCGLFDLIVGAYDDYGTYRCYWQSSPAGRVTQSAGRAGGLDIVTDGEMRRLSFQSQMTEAVDGFGPWDINAFLWGHWHGDGAMGERRKRGLPRA
jgi:hypothetical protein